MLKLNGDELLNVREVERETGIRHQSLYQAIREGRLKCASADPYLIRRSDMLQWLAARDAKKGRPG